MRHGKPEISPEQIAYLHGRIDKEIELASASLYCTSGELAEKLGSLLLGAGLRVEHNLSTLREDSTPSTGSETVATLALASSSHSKSSRKGMNAETRKKLSKLAKQRWSNLTPLQKKRLVNKLVKSRRKT